MRKSNRRQFLRGTATAVGLVGLGAAGVGGQAQAQTTQDGELPAYADWVPADTVVLNEAEELDVGSYPIDRLLAIDGELGEAETIPLQFESLAYASVASVAWNGVFQMGLGEAVFGPLSAQPPDEVDSENVPVQRQTNVDSTSVYSGSFDTDEIGNVVESDGFEATDRDEILRFDITEDFTLFLAWGSEFVIVGEVLDEVAAVYDAGTGGAQSRHEVDEDFEELVTAIDHSEFALTRLAEDGPLAVGEYGFEFDYSPLEGADGYATSVGFDSETAQFDGTTVALYPDEESIDLDRLEAIGAEAMEVTVTSEGRFARAESRFDRAEIGLDPEEDDSNGDDEDGDDGNGDDGNGDDGNGGDDGENGEADDTDDEADDTGDDTDEDADDDGAGFGVVAALSGLGGAGYLLSRRLGAD